MFGAVGSLVLFLNLVSDGFVVFPSPILKVRAVVIVIFFFLICAVSCLSE